MLKTTLHRLERLCARQLDALSDQQAGEAAYRALVARLRQDDTTSREAA